MSRYPLNVPAELKADAERLADERGVSLNQFILWALAEKVGALKHSLDEPAFPHITYRLGASGTPTPVIRGRNLHVHAIVVAANHWGLTPAQIADDYDLPEFQVQEALAFHQAHRPLIEALLAAEQELGEADV